MIKILITDDSALAREMIKDIFEAVPDIAVVGEAGNGAGAVILAKKLKPDLIIMDLMMPVMDGFTAIEEIMAETPTPILVLSASLDDRDLNNAFTAIKKGALDVIGKPEGMLGGIPPGFAASLVDKARMLARIKVIRRRAPLRLRNIIVPEGAGDVPRSVLAIGASTGGPQAVMTIVRSLPPNFTGSVFIVQHIANGFAAGFAQWLNRESRIPVRVANEGDECAPGLVLVAPSNAHMTVKDGRIKLLDRPPVNSCRPSIDVLFNSLAAEYGNRIVGVVLSGMGRDGAEGLTRIKELGGMTIAQDEQTCAVFGMPKAAIGMNAVDLVVPLPEIPETIGRLFKQP